MGSNAAFALVAIIGVTLVSAYPEPIPRPDEQSVFSEAVEQTAVMPLYREKRSPGYRVIDGDYNPPPPFWGRNGNGEHNPPPVFWGRRSNDGDYNPPPVFYGRNGEHNPPPVFWGRRSNDGDYNPPPVFYGRNGEHNPPPVFWGRRY